MSEHYTKVKEEKTAEMLERVLDLLVYAEEPIDLNGKTYKKINFSQGQVTDAIQEYALPEEHIQGIVFKDPSTISKSDTYKILINKAKSNRANRLLEDSSLSFEGREPSVAELKIEIDRLLYEKESLAKTVNGLESIVRQAGIKKTLEDNGELVSEPISVDKKLIAVLEKLLLLNSENELFYIEKGKGHVPSQVFYQGYEGTKLLCDVNDLKALNVNFDVDKYGKIVIVGKGIIYG
ncbi:MAG: Unknown protein [uncultured Sulfurovum sp.]|uniref:Uncharacterized protein n=1 Tax=uncultured Sulfurovum sp. TaxID=269237 RepID=A0A6S6RVW0_9BACT|nr:MAG: Unknown protein [uncultured Sulfurovum sp.]